MTFLRRLLVPVLFIALLVGTYAASSNIAFGTPDHIKTWLHDNQFYDHLVSYGVDQAVQATSPTDTASPGVAQDPNVVQAVKTAFPPSLVESSVNTFLDSNYAWLQGKTDQPEFSIDLNQAKQTLAQELGQYAGRRYASLPACSAADIAQLQQSGNYNLLAVNCQLPGVSVAGVSALVSQQVSNSSDVLQNPKLTPQTIGQNLDTQSKQSNKPYYQSATDAPHLYKFSQFAPWVAFAIALASAAGIVLLNPLRRKGLKVVGIVLAIAAAWLVISKFLIDAVFNTAEDALNDSSVTGQLQTAFVEVMHKAEQLLTKIDMWFAIGFAVIAAGIFLTLYMLSRSSQPAATPPKPPTH